MKKNLLFILVAILLASGGLYYIKFRTDKPIHPEYFLPENVLFYINQKDLGILAEDFSHKPLAQTLGSIDYVKLALDLEFSFATVNKIRDFRDFTQTALAKRIFQEFLSEEFSLALLPDNSTQSPEDYFKKNSILFSKTTRISSLLTLLKDISGNDSPIKSTQYGKHAIYRIDLNESTSVAIVFAEKMHLVCLEERTLRKVLDRYDNKNPNLSEDYFFKELQRENTDSQLFCFFKIDKLKQQITQSFKDSTVTAAELLSALQKWTGFTTGSMSAKKSSSYTKNRIRLYFNKYKLSEHTAHFLDIPPEKDPLINIVPNDSLLYYWTNTFDLNNMWDIFTSESGEGDLMVSQFEESLENMAEIPFSELLLLADNKIHVIVRQASTIDLVPVPNFSLIFHVNDRRKAELAVEKIVRKSDIPHKKDEYRNIVYTYWGEEIQRGLQPVYAFHDNNFFISSSVKTQTDIIDTIISGNNITQNDNFKMSGQALLTHNNSTLFINLPGLLDVTQKIVSWGGTMMAIQNRETAHFSKILINGFILPVIDGLAMYSSLASTSSSKNGVITVDTNIVPAKSEYTLD